MGIFTTETRRHGEKIRGLSSQNRRLGLLRSTILFTPKSFTSLKPQMRASSPQQAKVTPLPALHNSIHPKELHIAIAGEGFFTPASQSHAVACAPHPCINKTTSRLPPNKKRGRLFL